jgi:hypothetical protein
VGFAHFRLPLIFLRGWKLFKRVGQTAQGFEAVEFGGGISPSRFCRPFCRVARVLN